MKKILLASILATSVILTGCGEEEKTTQVTETIQTNSSTDNSGFGSLVEGEQYSIMKSKLDVGIETPHIIEFFWFGCPHCQAFEPTVKELKKKLGNNAEIFRVAAVTPNWRRDAQVYYTLVEMGNIEETFTPTIEFYQYIGETKKAIPTMEELKTHFESLGLNMTEFMEVYNSKEVSERMDEAQALFKKANLGGVPAFIVNGTHNIELRGLKTYEDLITNSRILLLNVDPKM